VDLSVVVPVYNSAECLPELAQRVRLAVADAFPRFELILVDDCSPGDSWGVIEDLIRSHPEIVALRLRKNVGQDNAIMAGLHQARGESVVIMDDDLQHDPEDIPRLCAELRSGFDVAFARFGAKRQVWWKNLGSWFTDRVATVLLGKPKHIYLSPYKALDRNVVQELVKYTGPFSYVDGLILTVTSNITQIEARHQSRFAGDSNYNLVRSIRVWLKLATSFSLVPLRIATVTGMIIAVASFLMAIYFVIEALFLARAPEGWPSLIVAVFFLGGVQLMGIGAVGEYIGRIFITLNKRPQFTIRDVVRGQEPTAGGDTSD
jgi:undecaprenyl-phosphate 4-deoxy-4-formamido-L-arabinose transferase